MIFATPVEGDGGHSPASRTESGPGPAGRAAAAQVLQFPQVAGVYIVHLDHSN